MYEWVFLGASLPEGSCEHRSVPLRNGRHQQTNYCSAPGEEIDHLAEGSNTPANLQLICKLCHNQKLFAELRADRNV